jgi:iron complex outermembrane receptor protein
MMKTPVPKKFLTQSKRENARLNGFGRHQPVPWAVVALGLVIFSRGAFAQTSQDVAAPGDLKKLSVEQLMDVEVTSVSLYPGNLLDAPSAIQVVTQDDIRRSGASSIPEALRLADNLEVAKQNSHDWNISARGFNTDLANKLLVLMDGRSVYTPLFSGVFWDVQDYLLEDIDQIEVISGPGGTQWGANAVNGVINITTKSAKDTQGLYLEGGGGTELEDVTGVRYGGTLAPNVYFRVYAKYFDRGSEVLANGSDASDSWNMAQGGFRIDDEASSQNNLTLQGDTYSGNENIPTGGGEKVGGGNVLGRWTHTFSDDSDTSLQLYYDRTHVAVPKPKSGLVPAGILTDDLDTYDLDFKHHLHLGEYNKIVWGLGYRFTRDVDEPAPTVVFLPTHLDQNLYSGFAQDEIKLQENLFFTLGTKVEHNDYTGWETEPSGRLQFNLTPKQMLWTAVSRAVRTPSRIDRDLSEPTGLPKPFPQSILNGSPDFISETVIAYEAGYRAQLGSKVTTSISVFYNDYDHVRSTTPGRPGFPTLGFPLVFQNNLEGETHGIELSASYQVLDWWRLHGGYDLLEEHLHVKPGQVDFSHALNETADPQNQFSLRSSMDLAQDVEFDTGLRWVDKLHNNNGPNPGTVPSYFELDARLGWNPTKRLELSLVGQNLLHDHHPEYGFPSPTREEIERSVYGKAVWRY